MTPIINENRSTSTQPLQMRSETEDGPPTLFDQGMIPRYQFIPFPNKNITHGMGKNAQSKQ